MSSAAHQIAKTLRSKLVRACLVGLAVLAAALAVGPALALATPLSCTGSTIYALQRPTKTSGEHGTVYGLTDSTVGGATATMTELSQLPNNSYPNALGVSSGGAGLWGSNRRGPPAAQPSGATTAKPELEILHRLGWRTVGLRRRCR